MSNVLTWRCACGRIFFSINLTNREDRFGRYIFAGICPKCDRTVRRCFNLRKLDLTFARRMVRASQGSHKFIIQRMWWYNNMAKTPNARYIQRMIVYMKKLEKGSVEITALLRRRVSVSYETIRKQSAVKYTLSGAPPYCHETLIDKAGLLRSSKIGQPIDVCPFCMISDCNQKGIRCTGIKRTSSNVEFLQIGRDIT